MPTQTAYLDIVLLDPNEAGKAVAAATGISQMAQTLGKVLTVDCSALTSPYTLPYSATEGGDKTGLHFAVLKLTGSRGVALTINLPAKAHFFACQNLTNVPVTLKTASGSGEILYATDEACVICDGTDVNIFKGAVGPAGADGYSTGIPWTYDGSSISTSSVPSLAGMRFNSSIITDATQIALTDLCALPDYPDVSAWISSFDDSTNGTKGHLIVKKATALENFVVFRLTSLTNLTDFFQLNVQGITGYGSFTSGDTLILEFYRSGDAGSNGSNGTNGANGLNGISSGLPWMFSSSTTMSDPGAGNIRVNASMVSNTLAGVSQVAVSSQTLSPGNPDVSGWLAALDDSNNAGSKGILILKKATGLEIFGIYTLTGITINSGWVQLSVTTLAASGKFTANDQIIVEFYRTGDKGTITRTINYVMDGGGSTLIPGDKGDLEVPFSGTLTKASIFADQAGSIVVDIWKDTYANYPPTNADSICGGSKLTLSGAAKGQNTALTGWNTSITAGDILRFNVDSATTITRVTVSLTVVE